ARGRQSEEALRVADLAPRLDPAQAHPPLIEGVRHVVLSGEPVPAYGPADSPIAAPLPTTAAEVYRAVVLGLRDYVRKNGFRSVILGLSGGIDSTLVAVIACDAIGAANVVGVS